MVCVLLDSSVLIAVSLTFTDVRTTGPVGHKQVTDAYLAQLARDNEGKVATLDRAMAALHPDVAELVPTS